MTGAAPGPSAEARQLAMVAHLLGYANFAFGFAGLIGAIVLYVTAKDDFVRENARDALNMQITWAIYSIALICVYLSAFVPMFFGAITGNGRAVAVEANFHAFGILFADMGALVLGLIVVAVFNGIGARKAYLGRAFRYPIAIPFLRPPEFPSPIATS